MFKKDKKPDNNIKISFKSNNKSIISLCQKYFTEKIFNEIHLSAVGGSIGNLVTIVEILKILVPDLYQQNRISTVTYQSIEQGTELTEQVNNKLYPKFDVTLSLEKPKSENEGFQNKLTEDERKKILDFQSKLKEDKKNKKKSSEKKKSNFNKRKIINRRGKSAFNRRRINGKFWDKKFESKKRTSFRKRFKSLEKNSSFKNNLGTNTKKGDINKRFNGFKRKSFSKGFRNNSNKGNDEKYNAFAKRTQFNRFWKKEKFENNSRRRKFSGFKKVNGGNRSLHRNNSTQKIKN